MASKLRVGIAGCGDITEVSVDDGPRISQFSEGAYQSPRQGA